MGPSKILIASSERNAVTGNVLAILRGNACQIGSGFAFRSSKRKIGFGFERRQGTRLALVCISPRGFFRELISAGVVYNALAKLSIEEKPIQLPAPQRLGVGSLLTSRTEAMFNPSTITIFSIKLLPISFNRLVRLFKPSKVERRGPAS